MRGNQSALVGVVVLLALALLVGVGLLLRGFGRYGATHLLQVRVADARGIEKDAEVRLHGVEIGRVDAVRLAPDGEPLLVLRVDERVRPDSNDMIRIVLPLIGFAPPYVEITRRPEGDRVEGRPPLYQGTTDPDFADLIPDVQRTLGSLNNLTMRMADLTGSFEKVASDPRLRRGLVQSALNLERMSGNFVVASDNFVRLTGQGPSLMDEAGETVKAARRAAGQFERMVGQLREVAEEAKGTLSGAADTLAEFRGAGQETRGLIAENREQLRELMKGLQGSLTHLDGVLTDTRSLVANPELRANLAETAANIRDASGTLRKIVEDVRDVTGNAQVQTDLRSAIAGLATATEEAGAAFRRINEVLGRGGQAARGAIQGLERLGQTELRADLMRGFSPGLNRLDVTAYTPWSTRSYVQLGLQDATEANKFNLQLGRTLSNDLAVRYGLYSSRLGVGLDFGPLRRPYATLNLYGLDDPLFDIRGYLPLSRNLDVALGVDRILGQSNPVLGVRYRR